MAAVQDLALALKAKLFRGLADPSRLAILEVLRERERTVGEIVSATGLTQSNASMHLACLRDCGLVEGRQVGRHVWYRVADPCVEDVLRGAEDVLGRVAERVYACTRYER
jgi:DNA-binding transcriptional ArsR family regulator